MSDRLYRARRSHAIPLWNGILEHREKIGMALWEFIWCLDRITSERNSVGLVLGGAPVKLETIVADLKGDKESTRRHLKTLKDGKYIRMRRTPYGQVIEVLNSKKFGIWRKEKPQSAASPPIEKPTCESEKPQSAVSKEDAAVKTAGKAAAVSVLSTKSEDSVWAALGIGPCGPPKFRELLESRWASKNGEPSSKLIGETVDAWEAVEGELPRRASNLFHALAALRKTEKSQQARETEEEIPIAQADL